MGPRSKFTIVINEESPIRALTAKKLLEIPDLQTNILRSLPTADSELHPESIQVRDVSISVLSSSKCPVNGADPVVISSEKLGIMPGDYASAQANAYLYLLDHARIPIGTEISNPKNSINFMIYCDNLLGLHPKPLVNLPKNFYVSSLLLFGLAFLIVVTSTPKSLKHRILSYISTRARSKHD